jgi:hypothetical protein
MKKENQKLKKYIQVNYILFRIFKLVLILVEILKLAALETCLKIQLMNLLKKEFSFRQRIKIKNKFNRQIQSKINGIALSGN